MKRRLKRLIMHQGLSETESIRQAFEPLRRAGWPYCPPDEGDVLFRLAQVVSDQDALQVGFATGSTAVYILSGLKSGNLTSIDYDQNNHERAGVRLVDSLGFSRRHRLIEENSIRALPGLYNSGARFGLISLDGWKTFDHVWVDTFYCARMLNRCGHIVFDDTRMPAVRKCISILEKYYGFQVVDVAGYVGGWKQKIWHVLSTRSFLKPYVVLQKVVEIAETDAGRQYDFWKKF